MRGQCLFKLCSGPQDPIFDPSTLLRTLIPPNTTPDYIDLPRDFSLQQIHWTASIVMHQSTIANDLCFTSSLLHSVFRSRSNIPFKSMNLWRIRSSEHPACISVHFWTNNQQFMRGTVPISKTLILAKSCKLNKSRVQISHDEKLACIFLSQSFFFTSCLRSECTTVHCKRTKIC
jgi:hypothetical protein